jgi:hypothetical protein
VDFSLDAIVPVLLLFSLAGGYFFQNWCYATKFRAEGHEWEQNLFEAAIIGCVLFVFTRIFSVPFLSDNLPQPILCWWTDKSKLILLPHIGSVFLSLITSCLAAELVNFFFPARWSARMAVQRQGDELLQLLDAAGESGYPVSLTMNTRKVYIGFVMSAPKLDYTYVRILPTLSGHRDEAALKLVFDTEYFKVYEALEKRRERGDNDVIDDERFCIILPITDICSANLFDDEVYMRYFQKQNNPASPRKHA